MNALDKLQATIHPLKAKLKQHALYSKIQNIEDVKVFMQYHVFCVWDFMNLLKTLQHTFTCTEVPFSPKAFPENTRLINEIVLQEESDFIDGQATSHFAYYVKTMQALSSPFPSLDAFLQDLAQNCSYSELIQKAYLAPALQNFLKFSFDCIQHSPIAVAAAFAFGRETLIPSLFEPLVSNPNAKHPQLKLFYQYIERHIELDAQSHGHLALSLVSNITHSESDWALATETAQEALLQRLALWDFIEEKL